MTDGLSSWILRRAPLGHVLATAHDMRREYRVLSALKGSSVPVPHVVAYCDDQDVLGASFYLMERVEGRTLRTAEDLASLRPADKQQLARAFVDAFARLQSDPMAAYRASWMRLP